MIPDSKGRLRSAGRFVGLMDSQVLSLDPYFSLPNTPDTEEPIKKMVIGGIGRPPPVMQRNVITLGSDLGGESYI